MKTRLMIGVSKEPALSPSKGGARPGACPELAEGAEGLGNPQKNTVGQLGRQGPIRVSETTDMDNFHENRAP